MAQQLTPMMKQYWDIKNKHKDKIVFFRLGDFYEMFFDDALIASKVLDITLTGRDCGLKERAPMCGIPHHAADSYIAKLIENNYKIAICEQTEDPAMAKGLVKREVVKVITPGTVISSNMLDENTNNYIMSAMVLERYIAISYLDLSTGEFYCTYVDENDKASIISEIRSVSPSELIINVPKEGFEVEAENIMQLEKNYYDLNIVTERLKKQFNVKSLEGLGLINKALILASGSLLLYLDEVQKAALKNIIRIKFYNINNYMIIDRNTYRNLEISETIRGKNKKGTLLYVLDKTSTSMGARKLKQWIEKPLIQPKKIRERLEATEELLNNFLLRKEVKDYLKNIYDIERLSSRIALGIANARDLISFKNSIVNLPIIKSILENFKCEELSRIHHEFDTLNDLFHIINDSIIDDPSYSIREGNLIKRNYNNEIDKYMDISKNGKQWIINMEQSEKNSTGIKSLKIGYNRVFGYYIEVTKSNIENVPEHYIRKQTLSNAERYITPELKKLEETVISANEKLIELEYQVFLNIREEISKHIKRIQNTAVLLAELDCFCSFAEIAQKYNYIKPEVGESGSIEIKEGRHPVIEHQNPNTFIPNDVVLDCNDNRLLIITGPNIAGKSTYMRQTALIVLMSQIGSFAPASYAKIGVVDRIFTRVGASDDLASGQSTFMVEMTELANIINSATENSLIILDEIGRGTSTFDGVSIAWAAIEYISDKNRLGCKTMFATHYHELTELENKINGIKNYYIAIEEKGKDIIFLRTIKRGAISGSYGIHVARLAGVPEEILDRSTEILKVLNKTGFDNKINITEAKRKKRNKLSESLEEPNLFNFKYFNVVEDIKNLDIHSITPMEALNLLNDIKNKLKE